MQAQELLEKYKAGNCTDAEKAIVETWYLKFSKPATELSHDQLEEATDRIWERLPIHDHTEEIPTPVKKSYLWPRIAAAAAVLLVTGIALFIFKSNSPLTDPDLSATANYGAKAPILPGGNKAILTLADGQQITLDEAGNGKLAEQSGITITKTKDGQLVYTVSAAANALKTAMNTIATPKGGQYQINLPDGTKVWLNAASSLRYPTAFSGEEREVSLSGEAYFEVARSIPKKSFKVSTSKQTVEVLGTHFNINAYADEPSTKTTLLEGSVKVKSNAGEDRSMVLKPGQQAALTDRQLLVNYGKEEEAIAWKNGVFKFEDEDLQSVMRSVARWYDLDVVYEGTLPSRQFSGEIDRNSNLSQVLDILSFFKVHFSVNGKQITVRP
ncbi:FecR family protein [Pedobacter gandavensis]|uniref:FecR family protein n=1 Tax=Pedobacter gandavensis TaxID=2679963 RepID=UPI00292CC92F|nr:FecR domain-containing protein [Pedobacter gandavensis]